MKLKLEHLAPYLPYGLISVDYFDGIELKRKIVPSNIMGFVDGGTKAKPILRPLSDFTKEIEVNGEKFVPKDKLFHSDNRWIQFKKSITKNAIHCEPYYIVENLLKWHFDVFGLIEQGLAVDINTL